MERWVPGQARDDTRRVGVAPSTASRRFPPYASLRERIADCGLAGRLVRGALQGIEFHLAQTFDLVAEAGGFFEFEVGGGFAHLGLEVLDDGGEVGADPGFRGDGLWMASRPDLSLPIETVTWSVSSTLSTLFWMLDLTDCGVMPFASCRRSALARQAGRPSCSRSRGGCAAGPWWPSRSWRARRRS